MVCPGSPGSRRKHQAAASRWVEQPNRETEHRGPRHGTRSQSPALCTPPPSRPRTQPAAAVRNHRSRLGEESREDFAPRTLGLGFPRRFWNSRLASPSRLQSARVLAGRPEKDRRLWPRPGPTPARRGAEPGAGVRSSSLPGAPESGRLLLLQPWGRRLPPPKLPGASRSLRAAPDAESELAHQVRKAAGFLKAPARAGVFLKVDLKCIQE